MAEFTLNADQREELIVSLVTNCAGWDDEDIELLADMDNSKLYAHARNCAELIHNEDIDESSELSDELEPSSAEELQDAAEDEGWEGETDPGGNQEPKGTTVKQDTKKDQPKKCHDEEGNEVPCPEGQTQAEGENVTENRWLAGAPPRIRSVVVNALRFEREQKLALANQITLNRRNRFTKEYLMGMDLEELQAIADLAVPPGKSQPIYTGAPGGIVANEDQVDRDDVLIPPTLDFSRKN